MGGYERLSELIDTLLSIWLSDMHGTSLLLSASRFLRGSYPLCSLIHFLR